LRYVRAGPDLYYGLAEGADGPFKFLAKFPFGSEDLRELRIIASTGGDSAALDVRVTDLRIRADGIPNMPVAAAASGPVPPVGTPQVDKSQRVSGGWLAAMLIIGLTISLLFVGAVGVWFFLHRRQAAPAEAKKEPARKENC
jgi:hypothetical protein